MPNKFLLVPAGMLCLLFTSNVNAETITKTVRSGYNSAIYSFAIYDKRGCRGGIFPKLSYSKAEQRRITLKKIKQVIPKGKRCAGNTFYYAVVYYSPNRGFRGKDNARFTLTYPRYTNGSGHRANKVKAKLTVR